MLLMILELFIKMVWRHVITILIVRGQDGTPFFSSPMTCLLSRALDAERINEDRVPSHPPSPFADYSRDMTLSRNE